MMKAEITFGGAKISLTSKELMELFFNTQRMIDWGSGGAYGDGEEITDKKNMAIAKSAERKLLKLINRQV